LVQYTSRKETEIDNRTDKEQKKRFNYVLYTRYMYVCMCVWVRELCVIRFSHRIYERCSTIVVEANDYDEV